MRSTLFILIFFIFSILAAGCSGNQQPAQTPAMTVTTSPAGTPPQFMPTSVPTPLSQASVSDNTVTIKDFAFKPKSMTVSTGAIVRWENMDSSPHRIMFTDTTGRDTGIESSVLSPSQSFSRKFDAPGTYPYYCTIHPEMKGTVIVV